MKGMKTRVVDTKAMAESEGLVVVEITPGTHIKMRLSNGHETKLFVFAGSPSDHRAHLNKRAELRRFAKEARA